VCESKAPAAQPGSARTAVSSEPQRVVSLNIGAPRPIEVRGKQVETGIYKQPVQGPVRLGIEGFEGDGRVERRVMGNAHHAVYAYSLENYDYWERRLACVPFPHGQFGENLTVPGLTETEVRIGDVWR